MSTGKHLDRSAIAVWSPIAESKTLLALGGCAPGGGVGVSADFASSADLEIFSMDSSGVGPGMSMFYIYH